MGLKGLNVTPNKQSAFTCAEPSSDLSGNSKYKQGLIFFLWHYGLARVMVFSLTFLDHTQRRTTVGRTRLDE
jgi:hypothetical protein